MNKLCSQCGKGIKVFPYRLKQTKFFCSAQCYGDWQRGRPLSKDRREKLIASRRHGSNNVKCAYCEKNFHKHPSAIRKFNFCCNEHRNKFKYPSQKRISICIYCGNQFHPKRKTSKFCSSHCMGLYNRKPFILKKGYKKILIPSHPRADIKGYVFEHIVVIESKLGRSLLNGEETHHIDGNKLNNNPDNLLTFKNHTEHMKNHPSK